MTIQCIEEKALLFDLLQQKEQIILFNALDYYDPYPFQDKFHNDPEPYRGLIAGNRPGKSFCGGAETAYHLTGKYPEDWKGRKFGHPIQWVAGGKNNEKTRDLIQFALFGDPANELAWGTGFVPKDDIKKATRKPGVPDAKYHVYVKHYTNGVYDGLSRITLLAYDMGKEGWMGFKADGVWLDEEPPEDIMGQASRSVIDSGGIIYMTFTPENGKTTVLTQIMKHWSLHHASWLDAAGGDFDIELAGDVLEFRTVYTKNGKPGHLTEEKVRSALKGMLPHEARMRVLGEPMQGSGKIFSHPQAQIMCEPLEMIPESWPRGAAIDFGGVSKKSHPTAVVWAAYDETNDVVYIYDAVRMYANEPADVAARIIGRPQWLPMFWPHDGNKTLGGGTVADTYARYGVNMFHTHVTNPDEEKGEGKGGIKVEPGLIDMNARFADRRLRVYNTLPDVWEEIRNYHMITTAQGQPKIVDRDDDLISAIRYVTMMLRHFVKEQEVTEWSEENWDDDYTTEKNIYTGY